MRQIQITIQNEQKEIITQIFEIINIELSIKSTILLKGERNSLIIIRQKRTHVPELIERLESIGVGTDYGVIDIIPLEATIPELADGFDGEEDLVPERLALEEIRIDIEEGAQPTITHFIFILLSAIMAGIGLILNSPVVILASMIISPLMGPILGLSFGILTSDSPMIKNSIIAQVIGILLSIGSGIMVGLLAGFLLNDPVITFEMSLRRFPSIFDVIIAVCAGLAVGFCITGTVNSTLVGPAIALSLMPPAVNVGLAYMYGDPSLAFGSLILLLTNIVTINLCTMLVLRIKKID